MSAQTPTLAVRSATPPSFLRLLGPGRMLRHLWSHRELILQLAAREIRERYRGAQLGFLWVMLPPLLMLAVYTFVFSVLFDARWGRDPAESRGEFALTLFAGMVLYQLFADVVARAPGLVASQRSYVKKVVFPLEILVVTALVTALFTTLVGYGVWMVGWLVVEQSWPHWTALWLPVVLLPVALATAGVAWVLASLGVFVRDLGPAVTLGVQALFFLTPVFYSLDAVPASFRPVLQLNPLTHAVEAVRRVLVWGEPPEWTSLGAALLGSGLLALVGHAFFARSQRAFADVL